jgi:hypothetical protein
MGFTFSVGDLSAFAEVIVSGLNLIVAVVTLLILWGYARDTKAIAKTSVLQAEESSIPYLSIRVDVGEIFTSYVIVNQGPGPALDIVLSVQESTGNPRSLPPVDWVEKSETLGDLGIDEDIYMPRWAPNCAFYSRPVTLTYRSLYGSTCQSSFQRLSQGTYRKKFRRA